MKTKHMKQHTYTQGFTLMEIMIVIVILGILVMMATGSFMSSQIKSRDNKRKSDLRNIATALESYYNDKARFPNDNASGAMMGCGSNDISLCDWGAIFSDKNSTIYMPKLPQDPKSGYTYYYDSLSSNRSYQLYARLENTQDKDVLDATGNPKAYSGVSCGTKNCNYGVSSSNITADEGRTIINE